MCASVSGSTVQLGQDRLSGVQAMRRLGHRDGTHAMPGVILRQPFFTHAPCGKKREHSDPRVSGARNADEGAPGSDAAGKVFQSC